MQSFKTAFSTHNTLKRSLVIGFLFGLALYVLAQLSAPGQFAFAAGTYSGTVFRDYNANGVKDTREPGIGGVTVTLYDSTNVARGTTTSFQYVCAGANSPAGLGCTAALTPALGSWSIAATGTGPYRVEFTTLPAYMQNGAHSVAAGGNATAIQFVADGGATNVNFGVNDPGQYVSSTNPTLATTELVAGSHTGITTAAVVSYPYNSTGTTAPTTESQHQQVGATWGITYRRATGKLYVAAFEKRMSDFGTGGSGTIYEITPGGAADGTAFATIPGAAGGHSGTWTCTTASGQCDGNGGGWDTSTPTSPVGKAGLGALVISDDDSTMYTVNLATKHLFSVTFAGPTVTDIGAVPHAICTNGTDRPFGLGFHDGKVYMGGVCDASSGGSAANLSAYVYEWDPTTAFGTAALVLSFPLNYDRTCADSGGYAALPFCDRNGNTTHGPRAIWHPWTDTIATAIAATTTENGNGTSYPMPMLTKIQFDNSDMIISLRDRLGDMLGPNDPGPNGTNPITGNRYEDSAGDILRANPCPASSTTCSALSSGGWVLESNSRSNPAGIFGPTTIDNGEGPGTGCTPYATPTGCARFFIGNDGLANGGLTQEYLSTGGMVQVPGFADVALNAVDPINVWSNGTIQLSNTAGTRSRSYQIYCTINPLNPTCNGPAVTGTFAKANGLGDLVALLTPAPIEIGNRVWQDTNGDGIQEPGEAVIAGVTVHLYNAANTLIGTAVTDANGNYYFSSDTTRSSTTSEIFSIAGLTANTTGYKIKLDLAADYTGTGPLVGYTVTSANAGSNDQIDSDATLPTATNLMGSANPPTISVDMGAAGVNDHTRDFGLTKTFSLGNRVWLDDGTGGGTANDGIQNGTEAGIDGVTMNLLRFDTGTSTYVPQLDSTGAAVTINTATATGGGTGAGWYRFDNLPAGIYKVQIAPAEFQTGGTLFGDTSSPGTSANDLHDKGVDANNLSSAGLLSSSVTLGLGLQPTGEATSGTTGNGAQAPNGDSNGNFVVDFGLVHGFSIGNRVWFDDGNGTGANQNNGTRDTSPTAESGVSGVLVNLLDNAGNPVLDGSGAAITATTNANGYYRFDFVPAGTYKVQIDETNFGSGKPLFGYTSSSVGNVVTGNVLANDNKDNGVDNSSPQVNGITSSALTVGTTDNAPTTEADTSGVTTTTTDARENLTVDFGFTPAFSLGNRIWLDDGTGGGTANDGIKNGTEPGVSGVTVQLRNAANTVLATTTTDASGYYRFDNLPAGSYNVNIPASQFTSGGALFGYTSSTNGNVTAGNLIGNDSKDNGIDDAAPATNGIHTANVTLGTTNNSPTGETDTSGVATTTVDARENLTVDLGFKPLYSIGNRVWLDDGTGGGTANDGIKNGTETGASGVTVQLRNSSNTVIATTTTGANGYYRFDNLDGGTYNINIPSTMFTTGNPLFGYTSSTNGNVTAGNVLANDSKDNGIDDAAPTANGIHTGNVTLGPANNAPTTESDTSGVTVTTADSRENLTVDLGFKPLYSIGNRIWLDDGTGAGGVANDGILNGTEAGISGVTVQLRNSLNTVIATTTTNASGYYRFDNLDGGTYNINIPAAQFTTGNPLFGYISSTNGNVTAGNTLANDKKDNGIDDTAPAANGTHTANFTLGPANNAPTTETDTSGVTVTTADNRENLTIDLAFTPGYSIGNRVWFDTDNSGALNSETGVSGVTVALIAQSTVSVGGTTYTAGQTITTATTDASGYYRFDSLPPGTYSVSLPASNWTSGAKPLAGYQSSTGQLTQSNNNPNTTADLQDNGNNPADYTTSGVSSTNIILGATNPAPTSDTTDTSGVATTTVNARENLTADFGLYRLTVGNTVFRDDGSGAGGAANDGIQNGTEAGISGVQVKLFQDVNSNGTIDANELVAVVTTDASGNYVFTQQTDAAGTPNGKPILPASNYKVQLASGQTVLLGYQSSADGANASTPMGADSDDNGVGTANANTNNTTTAAFTISNGGSGNPAAPLGNAATGSTGTVNNPRVDLGLVPLFSIGNRVWRDNGVGTGGVANNGIQDGTEAGISSVTISLYQDSNSDGQPDGAALQTTTTDANGYYSFSNLIPGKYLVGIDAANFATGKPLVGLYSSSGTKTGDKADNGVDRSAAGELTSGILSTTLVLGATDNQPTGTAETDFTTGQTQGGTQNNTTDARANLQIDFGFQNTTPTATDMGKVTGTANADGSVTISWESLNELNILGFNVLRSETKKGTATMLNPQVIAALSVGEIIGHTYQYQDTSAAAGTTYFYRVEILRAAGSQEETPAVKVTTAENACSAAPDAPELVGPTDGSKVKKNKVTFTWNASACAASYKWELRADAEDGVVVESRDGLTTTETSIKKLSASKTYYWQVWACNVDGACTASGWWQIHTRAAKPKIKPTPTP